MSNTPAATQAPRPPRPPRPNYNKIHAQPLPLTTYPLPALIPHNPLSALRIAYIYLSHLFLRPSSHPASERLYRAYYDDLTQSIHVTDPAAVRALWEKGFFGKGSLSRSEPEWLKRMEQRMEGELTSAEVTRRRREERREGKIERARKEAEAVEEQLAREKGAQANGEVVVVELKEDVEEEMPVEVATEDAQPVEAANGHMHVEKTTHYTNGDAHSNGHKLTNYHIPMPSHEPSSPLAIKPSGHPPTAGSIHNQEHLQLTPSEAFFLHYALGILHIYQSSSRSDPSIANPLSTPCYTTADLLSLFRRTSVFPPHSLQSSHLLRPDDSFLLNYIVYHHFRSLGWVVRPGIKFAVDFLLYYRGPAFSHAEFAVLIMPSYEHAWWRTEEGMRMRQGRGGQKEKRDWWWLHAANRVQAQVRKTLVLVYVEVPPPKGWREGNVKDQVAETDVGALLRRYRVREFVLKRWTANRNRD